MQAPLLEKISAAIAAAEGRSFGARNHDAPGGGCISRALVLEGDGQRYFVKLNDADKLPLFEAEMDGLAALAANGALRVPRAIACGAASGRAFLVLEYLELSAVTEREAAVRFGQALAQLHRQRAERFGWHSDNFIGATLQANAVHANWPFFFAYRRLAPQLELAARRGAERTLVSRGEKLVEKLAALFVDHRPAPSLLHGDLWHGNAALLPDGTPVVFDPAVYYGDREADLAMSELFGGFPNAFYAAYREAWPLPSGYEQRKTLYNLYHILNHYNLFGAAYQRQARRMIDSVLAELHA
ncbi:MAG: fructosamine kinase family protein [Pseudomonadota bacterium]|jgi:fructosamine-3-kinase